MVLGALMPVIGACHLPKQDLILPRTHTVPFCILVNVHRRFMLINQITDMLDRVNKTLPHTVMAKRGMRCDYVCSLASVRALSRVALGTQTRSGSLLLENM